jgi:malate dehydrogenase (oxaloacetate-decarboxylating)
VLPLSNPTSKCEADPKDVMFWTQGRALVATGSPFPDVHINGQTIRIGQCNNSFIFPGVGLGIISSKARRVTDQMMYAAANALANYVTARNDPLKPLYPPLQEVREVSRLVAISVAKEAVKAGLADPLTDAEIEERVNHCMWEPHYSHYHYING